MSMEGLRSTGEEFVTCRELWNIGGKIEEIPGKLIVRMRERARECFRTLELGGGTGESEDWNSVGQLLENLGELDGAIAGESGEARLGNCWRIWGNLGES